ncbi:hypothetical protein B0T14DRAFT_524646 [Immersiella caudata]|uniref:Uncharacterized protein n=1 Tax=Immersiella caudata TaxID=314043 RepID=A0AA39WKQ3_9PEZI|nr:hypothetical protein B0T14DRAFT_524646 [Immersiella caudata]
MLGGFEPGARFCLGFYCVWSVWAVGSHLPFIRPLPVTEPGRHGGKRGGVSAYSRYILLLRLWYLSGQLAYEAVPVHGHEDARAVCKSWLGER